MIDLLQNHEIDFAIIDAQIEKNNIETEELLNKTLNPEIVDGKMNAFVKVPYGIQVRLCLLYTSRCV